MIPMTRWLNNLFDPQREPEVRHDPNALRLALEDVDDLHMLDRDKWARASLMLAVALTREGAFEEVAKEIVARVRSEVGPRFDVLTSLSTIAGAVGRQSEVSVDDLRLAVRTIGDAASFLAARHISAGVPPQEAFARGRQEASHAEVDLFPNLTKR